PPDSIERVEMGKKTETQDTRAWLENSRSGWRLALTSALGGARVLQTLSVLAKSGAGWWFGSRPPLPSLVRQTCEELGTTYIKLGQFIASSPSIFPEQWVEEFQKCLDRTPALPCSFIRKTVEEELGRSLEDAYKIGRAHV